MAAHQAHVPGQALAQKERTLLEMLSSLDIYSEPVCERFTGIVCTVGPSCRTVPILRSLIKSGMDIARLNFSHGDHKYHAESIALVREAAEGADEPVAIALDTKGPEIRTGYIRGADKNPKLEVDLVQGSSVVVTTDEAYKYNCDEKTIYIDYKNLAKVVKVGGRIFAADGLVILQVARVLSTAPGAVECIVVNNAKLGSQKGVNLPGARVDLPAISEQDARDLAFAVEQGVDFIFASFIRKRQDVIDIRKFLKDRGGGHMFIVAKIENHEGVQNFSDILEETDGVMVARGDLGIEIPSEKVFLAQKMMIAKCNRAGKPVICATQMLESMVTAPRPTRAEGTDVANAVIDGSDCVMLSGETAKGDYPVEAVSIMARICLEAEMASFYSQFREELRLLTQTTMTPPEACALAAVDAAVTGDAKAIVCLSYSGHTARLLSKWRPHCPVLSVTRDPFVARMLRICRGLHTLFYKEEKREQDSWLEDVDRRVAWALGEGKRQGLLKPGDTVVVVHGWYSGPGHTNTVRIMSTP